MCARSGLVDRRQKNRDKPRVRTAREAFREIGIALTSRLELEDVLRSILKQVHALLKPSDSLLYILDDSRKELVIYPRARRKNPRQPVMEEGIAAWVMKNGKSVVTRKGVEHLKYSTKTDLPARGEERALCCVPISTGDQVRGAIEVLGKRFSGAQLEILHTIADFAAVAIENSKYVGAIEDLTITDDLTGLFNARYLGRILDMEVRRAQRYGEKFSIVFVDLDKFKNVNDKFGHLTGSRVLKETGAIITGALRKDIDSAFRYGGDEFVLVLPNTSAEGAHVVAGRIQKLMRNRLFASDAGKRFGVTASFGIAAFPRDAVSREDIVKMADEAMYEVKRRGRDGIASRHSTGTRKIKPH